MEIFKDICAICLSHFNVEFIKTPRIMNNPRAPSATYMLQGIHMHIATHILNKILQYVCVGILHYTT